MINTNIIIIPNVKKKFLYNHCPKLFAISFNSISNSKPWKTALTLLPSLTTISTVKNPLSNNSTILTNGSSNWIFTVIACVLWIGGFIFAAYSAFVTGDRDIQSQFSVYWNL